MPVYEYLCQSCRHRFEVTQRMSDPPLKACERCGQPVSKLISPPAIMFKGSGWYVTDYSDKMKPTEKSESQTGDPAKPKEGGADSAKPGGTESSATSAAASGSSSSSPTPAASSSSTSSTPSAKPSST